MNHEVLEKLKELGAVFEGTRLSISGRLCVRGDSVYFEIGENGDLQMPISDATLVDRLLDVAACRLGGEFLYREQASIVGVIEAKGDDIQIAIVESGSISNEDGDVEF